MAKKNKEKVTLIPLGGMGEIGKNLMVIEYGGHILLVDAGMAFPEEEMLGIDAVIPDISYLTERKDRVLGIFLTHGHEDHIGALPYLLKQMPLPVYGTRLTNGLVELKLNEHGVSADCLRTVKAGDSITIGPFIVDLINVNHSIPDTVGVAIHTPAGVVVMTSDFKFDHTPIGGQVTNFHKFAELGDQGVLVLLSDSTNVERRGYTPSERMVFKTFDNAFREARGRVIVTTFASNVYRIQQIINASVNFGRKVAIVGRSMSNVVNISQNLGYMQVPEGVLIDLSEIDNYPLERVTLITAGSQGEPMSALTRIANSDYRRVNLIPGDTVIISATPIPGNEKMVARTINHLFKLGAKVVYDAMTGVHVSGHASQEELKMMLNLVRPKYFVPVHGEYRHLVQHAQLAEEIGIEAPNIFIAENGDVLEFSQKEGRLAGKVPSGKVLVDGLGVGDVGNIVLRDRKQLSQDGIVIVVTTISRENGQVLAGPDVVTRGFVYVRESEELIEEARIKVKGVLEKCLANGQADWTSIKSQIREFLSRYLYEKTKRRPMILPIVMEV
ncbi:MAG TPA: ribonuclease J [Firmicutes bacterium]|jgi:ribonuclease J|nr:ribonuclease J [Bacillota bacterium]HAW70542.1 ribonuclease J [Bacillota bacterium]HAZ22949.1 ribonuclease J [Bacillota bacterium]HBE05985.1 ribonuclease J [Bacillota bacterium]HBG43126.1 ribonuclease J [Bacillota bacterium]